MHKGGTQKVMTSCIYAYNWYTELHVRITEAYSGIQGVHVQVKKARDQPGWFKYIMTFDMVISLLLLVATLTILRSTFLANWWKRPGPSDCNIKMN